MAEYLLETHTNLDWLESIWRVETPNLPSWAPDWSVRKALEPMCKTHLDGTPVYSTWGGEGELVPGSKTFPRYQVRNGRELHLRGVVIDTICSREDHIRGVDELAESVKSWVDIICDLGLTYQPTGEPSLHAAFKTLFFDVEQENRG